MSLAPAIVNKLVLALLHLNAKSQGTKKRKKKKKRGGLPLTISQSPFSQEESGISIAGIKPELSTSLSSEVPMMTGARRGICSCNKQGDFRA